MRINQVRFLQPNYNSKLKTQKNQKVFTAQKDTISFRASAKLKAPTTPTMDINWALKWDKQDRKNELDTQYEKAVKEMSFWKRNFTYAPEELRAIYDKTLEREEIAAITLIKNSAFLSDQQRENLAASAANKAKQEELDAREQEVLKFAQASKIAAAFKISDSGSLDQNIAGYEAEKQIIRDAFVEQVALEKAGSEAKVPNSILLYGAIGTGKTTFAKAAAQEAGCKFIEMNPDASNFASEVYKELKDARERYLTEGRRTVIQLNEVEAYLENAKNNYRSIVKMKSWLDNCAKLPTDEMQSAYATTFFFTTNHPLEITDELLYREEKIGKIIALEPAAEGNIEAIIRFYVEKFDKEGTLINLDDIDFESIIAKMNPDDEKGAFGNDKIKKIVEDACRDFNQDIDNKKSFEEYLNERIDKAKRNIKPIRLQEYREQLKELYEG